MNNVILVGNPNTGKTTLFNTMTKSMEKASNWHGVTVSSLSKNYKFNGDEFSLTDLPGLYSLKGYSNEEKIAADYLKKNKDGIIINICDANNLDRNLRLTFELLKMDLNVILAVNMYNEVPNINYDKLEKLLKIPVVKIDARKKQSVDNLKEVIFKISNKIKTQKIINYDKIQLNFEDLNDFSKKINFNNRNSYKITDKIDKIVLNKVLFLPIFLIVTFLIFYLTFGPLGTGILNIFNYFLNKIFNILRNLILCLNISTIIKTFLISGVIDSIETVLGFIPQIVLLLFFVNFLEDIGFMSRVAFMFDGFLKKMGLTGKSLFSLMMGFGCTTSAVLTTRNLENKNLRKRTVLLLPFMNCTAKLPVFLVVSSLFFKEYKYLFVFLLYVFSIIISIGISFIYKKVIKQNEDIFILEMPKYRFPSIKKIFIDSLSVIKEFLIKVGSTILFFSVIVWFLRNFSISFKFLNGENFSESILFWMSQKLVPIFSFIGINSAGMVSALLLGIIAKEMVIVGLAAINGVASIEALSISLLSNSSACYFSPVTSIVFLCFILIYSPCISAIAMIKNELGSKMAIYVFVSQFVLAYVVSFLIYRTLIDYRIIFAFVFFIILDIVLAVVLKLNRRKKKCRGDCRACRKVCC